MVSVVSQCYPRNMAKYGKFPCCFLASMIMVMVITISLSVFTIWYPQGIEDFLINQEWLGARNQPLPTTKFSDMGKEEMSRSTVTVLGVAKNIAHKLPTFLPSIEQLVSYFPESQAVFVEGDSSDETLQILQSWASHSIQNRTIYSVSSINEKETTGVFAGKPMPREGRLAAARNHALKVLHSLPKKTKYVIIVDLDVIGWNILGIQDSFGRPSWDVMCANGVLMYGVYRDTYAFRMKGITTNHHLGGLDHGLYNMTAQQRVKNREMLRDAKYKVKDLLDSANTPGSIMKPLEVESCFGGMAIYRYDTMVNCTYAHRDASYPHMLDCEHVLYHECLRTTNHARIFVNPHMKLWYGHAVLEKIHWKDVFPYFFPAR